jgi:hypothetical protein
MKTLALTAFLTVMALVAVIFVGRPLLASGISLNPGASAALQFRADQPQPSSKQESTAFTGRIAQSNAGQFVLQDSATNFSFKLDDQQKAKSFNGRDVKVIGTLDPSNSIIHVVEIEAV